jgi:hypothetical protein
MVYTTDDAQLLGLWTAIRFLWELREIEDPIAHDEILMRTQLLLTAFAVGLEPRVCDQTRPGSARAGLGQVVAFDA